MTVAQKNFPPSLRSPAPVTPSLSFLYAQKRTRIVLAAGISSSKFSDIPRGQKPTSRPPTGERDWVMPDEWDKRWADCVCHEERLQVLKDMDLQLGVQSLDRSRVRGTLEWKLKLARDERASAVVGREFGVSASRVRQLRMDYVAGRLFEKK